MAPRSLFKSSSRRRKPWAGRKSVVASITELATGKMVKGAANTLTNMASKSGKKPLAITNKGANLSKVVAVKPGKYINTRAKLGPILQTLPVGRFGTKLMPRVKYSTAIGNIKTWMFSDAVKAAAGTGFPAFYKRHVLALRLNPSYYTRNKVLRAAVASGTRKLVPEVDFANLQLDEAINELTAMPGSTTAEYLTTDPEEEDQTDDILGTGFSTKDNPEQDDLIQPEEYCFDELSKKLAEAMFVWYQKDTLDPPPVDVIANSTGVGGEGEDINPGEEEADSTEPPEETRPILLQEWMQAEELCEDAGEKAQCQELQELQKLCTSKFVNLGCQ